MPRQTRTLSRHTTDSQGSETAVDTSFLEFLLGYNARRAALAIIEVFLDRMAVYDLGPADFSLLSLV